jgi:hypothetical protein
MALKKALPFSGNARAEDPGIQEERRPQPLHRLLHTLRGPRHPVGLRPALTPRSMEVELLSQRWAPPAGATLPWLAPP